MDFGGEKNTLEPGEWVQSVEITKIKEIHPRQKKTLFDVSLMINKCQS